MSLSLGLSIAALVISVPSAAGAVIAAVAARRSAKAAEGTLTIEQERRLEERRPRLTIKLDGTGKTRVLKVTLDTEEPLGGLDITIAEWHFYRTSELHAEWECEFSPRVYGVVPAKPGNPALQAYSYNPHTGERAGLQPHQMVSWRIDTKDRLSWVRLNVACHGTRGERWDLVPTVEADPEIKDTVA